MSFKNYLNVYEFETVLPGSGETISFKPITTGELKKLLVYENEKDERVIEMALDQLISSSVQNEDFNIENLYLQDRFFLLVEIRKKTKGESYRFKYICDKLMDGKKCNTQTLQNIDLNSLPTKTIQRNADNKIELTDNITVKIAHITRGNQIEAHSEFDGSGMTPLQQTTEMALLTHAAGIKSIKTPEGEEFDISIEDRKFLLENISTGSYELIKKWYEKNKFGVDFIFEIKCSSCGETNKIDIPLHNFFF